MTKNTRRHLLGLGTALLATSVFSQHSDSIQPIVGTWTGVLETGSQRLRLRIVIHDDGKASIYSLDQGGDEIPARLAKSALPAVHIDAKAVKGEFVGGLAAPDRIEGIWKQGGDLPLVLLRGDAGLATAPKVWEPLTQDALERLRKDSQAPAMAAAMSVGVERRRWMTGRRATLSPSAVKADDQWHLGSITKSMTATMIARCVDAGMITFDDTVEQHLGDVAPRMQTAYRAATFRHLLCHRGGVPGALPMLKFMSFIPRGSMNLREQRRDWARAALEMKPLGPAADTFEYSNNGYVVAGAMLEAAFDQTWEDLMREHLFRPLGLASAGFGPPRGAHPLGHRVGGNSRLLASLMGSDTPPIEPVADHELSADNPRAIGPAGTVHMKLDDVLTYLSAHRDRIDFLKPDTWRALHTPPYGGEYAMGWSTRPGGILWHNGSNTLWYAEVVVDTVKRRCAVAVTNEARARAQQAVGAAVMSAVSA